MQGKHYKDLIMSAPFGYAYHKVITDESGEPNNYIFLEINSAFENLTGLKSSDVINRSVKEVFPGLGSDGGFDWIEFFGEIAINGGEKEFEQFSEPLNRWYKVKVFSPEKFYFSTVFTDITEEKNKAEELEGFFSVNLDLLCIADLEGNFLKINKEWEETLGYTSGEIMARKFLEFIHPDDIEPTLEAMSKLDRQESVLNFVNRYRRKDGSYRFIEWRSFPLGNSIYAAARDITERMETVKALRESESNFRTFFESMNDIIFITEPDGNIIYANSRMYEKLGYPVEDIINMPLSELYAPDRRDESDKYFREMLAGERDYCPVPLQKKDGNPLQVETRVWPGKWGSGDCLFAISKDIAREQEALLKFSRIFENNPALMAINSFPDAVFVDVNSSFVNKLGYSKQETLGKSVAELGVFADEEERKRFGAELARKGRIHNAEVKVRAKTGDILYGLFSGEVIESYGERFYLTVLVDITEQVKLRIDINRERQRLDNLITGTNLGTWEWNVQTGETVFNERWADIIGYRLEELEPVSIETWMKFSHPDDLKKSEELLNKHFRGEEEYYNCECRMKHRNGSWVWVHDRGKVIEWDSHGKPVMMFGTHADITEKHEAEDIIYQHSIRDPLTDVYNRRHLFERLNTLVSESKRGDRKFTVSILDIDHFKEINDTYGHQAGDYILKEFTRVIQHNIRDYDILGRYGGEEFLIVMLNTDLAGSIAKTGVILDAVRSRVFKFNSHEIKFTFSCGISGTAEFSGKELSADSLLKMADSRLYMAKSSGRNRIIAEGG